ncbi:hypothetical protein I3271_05680 [Photobacterium leiognathi]|uniref:hypothetical protein n=1 Tax=Photobacterium leiognathi TaxID=553611 RepID=UPI001EDD9328|nr:hypothetical protein [Photobacterium leiognathi]MCG3884172.1 hypothetical protein [Photobacterium leiognathi]
MIKLPTKEQLSSMIDDVTANKTENEFVLDQIHAINDIISSDPRQYRAYGVFWWRIKSIMLDHGFSNFGALLDGDLLERLNHLTDSEVLCAAYCNKIAALEDGRLYSSTHIYDAIDGETTTYDLSDLDMERLITNQ